MKTMKEQRKYWQELKKRDFHEYIAETWNDISDVNYKVIALAEMTEFMGTKEMHPSKILAEYNRRYGRNLKL